MAVEKTSNDESKISFEDTKVVEASDMNFCVSKQADNIVTLAIDFIIQEELNISDAKTKSLILTLLRSPKSMKSIGHPLRSAPTPRDSRFKILVIEEYFAGRIDISLFHEKEEHKKLRIQICFKFWLISFLSLGLFYQLY